MCRLQRLCQVLRALWRFPPVSVVMPESIYTYTNAGPGEILSKVVVLGLAVCLIGMACLAGSAKAATSWYVAAETVAHGSSNGYSNEQQNDALVNIKTEGSTENVAPLLVPNGDVAVNWDRMVGSCAGTTHTACLTKPGEPDLGTSYIGADLGVADPEDIDRLAMSLLVLPAGTQVVSVTAFGWASWSGTPLEPSFWLGINDATADCAYSTLFIVPEAWVNYSYTWPLSCDGNAWTVADVAAMQILLKAGAGGAATQGRCTYAGLLVTYRINQYVFFASQFNSVEGLSTTLVYECTTTDESNQLTVTYLAMPQGSIICDGIERLFNLPTDVGTIQVILSSAPTGDLTASTFTFDVLYLTTETQGDGDDHGGGTGDLVSLDCRPTLTQIKCSAWVNGQVVGLSITYSEWFIDGRAAGTGYSMGGAALIHYADLDYFSIKSNVTVYVRLYLSNSQMLEGSTDVLVDNSWIILVVLALLLLVIITIIYLVAKRGSKVEARKAKRENKAASQEKNWRWQLFEH